jgi:Holliday junction resolvase RusA-like endonuclease
MTPIEFVIPQRPVSQQARRRERVREWQQFVAAHARGSLSSSHELATGPVALRLLYLYDEVALDVDNILKPIHDALIGVILEDDSVVTDVEIRLVGGEPRSRSMQCLLCSLLGSSSGGNSVRVAH